jgi:hypothetical protein
MAGGMDGMGREREGGREEARTTPLTLTAAAPSACAILERPPELPSGEGASSGMSISSSTTARS